MAHLGLSWIGVIGRLVSPCTFLPLLRERERERERERVQTPNSKVSECGREGGSDSECGGTGCVGEVRGEMT